MTGSLDIEQRSIVGSGQGIFMVHGHGMTLNAARDNLTACEIENSNFGQDLGKYYFVEWRRCFDKGR